MKVMENQTWTWIVPQKAKSQRRADLYVFKTLLENPITFTGSRAQVQRLMTLDKIWGNEQPLKPNSKILPGMSIRVEWPKAEPLDLKAEPMPLEILFQDSDLAVVNKPAGLTVHPSPTQKEPTLVHGLLHSIKDLSGLGGKLRPGIVHRLDKLTSGAMVITKTDFAHTHLSRLFSQHQIIRKYWALCYGSPKNQKIESFIGRNPRDRKKMVSQAKGKRAVSHVRVLSRYQEHPQSAPFASLVEVTLETGRTHQVRVHLTQVGHSVLGDPLYGLPQDRQKKWTSLPSILQEYLSNDTPGQYLHARDLGFAHPHSLETLLFEAPLPERFSRLLELLKPFQKMELPR